MQQMLNIIRVDEGGGASSPHIVHERVSEFAPYPLKEGFKLIREQRGPEAYLLVCESIKDAVFEDIEPPKEEKQIAPDTYSQTVTDNNGNTNNKEEVTL